MVSAPVTASIFFSFLFYRPCFPRMRCGGRAPIGIKIAQSDGMNINVCG